MSLKFGGRLMRDFDGGKLPHARKHNLVVGAGVADQHGPSARVAQDCRGNLHPYTGAFPARDRNLVRETAPARDAPPRYRAYSTLRNLRRTDRFAEFHQSLVPISGRVCRQQLLRHRCEFPPTPCRTEIAANSPSRASTRATLPSKAARGTSYAILK